MIGPQETPCHTQRQRINGLLNLTPRLPCYYGINRAHSQFLTCDRNNVEKPPHGLRADVTKPVFTHQQLGEVKGHLPGDGPLHLPAPVSVLKRV